MKIRLQLTLAACAVSAMAMGQVPNGSFETWSNYTSLITGITVDQPDNWDTPDRLAADLGITDRLTEKESTEVQDGSFAAKMTSKELTVLGSPLDVPGTVTTGKLDFDFATFTPSISGGYPYTGRPDDLTGYYEYAPAGTDTAYIGITLTSNGNVVGGGSFTATSATVGYQMFDITLTYFLPDDPDTLFIIASSSASFSSVSPGSEFYLDNLKFTGASGVAGWTALGIKPDVYPNPANNTINISDPKDYPVMIEMYNLQGQRVASQELQPDMNAIDISSFSGGLYTYRILDKGSVVFSGKFEVMQ